MTYHQNLLIQDRLLLCCNNRRALLLLLIPCVLILILGRPPVSQCPEEDGLPCPYNQTPRPTAQLKPVPYNYLSVSAPSPDHSWHWRMEPSKSGHRALAPTCPALTVVFPNWVFLHQTLCVHVMTCWILHPEDSGNVGGSPGGVRLTRVN